MIHKANVLHDDWQDLPNQVSAAAHPLLGYLHDYSAARIVMASAAATSHATSSRVLRQVPYCPFQAVFLVS